MANQTKKKEVTLVTDPLQFKKVVAWSRLSFVGMGIIVLGLSLMMISLFMTKISSWLSILIFVIGVAIYRITSKKVNDILKTHGQMTDNTRKQ